MQPLVHYKTSKINANKKASGFINFILRKLPQKLKKDILKVIKNCDWNSFHNGFKKDGKKTLAKKIACLMNHFNENKALCKDKFKHRI